VHDVHRLAQALLGRRVPLVLDYAYWEYAAGGVLPSPMDVCRRYPNVIALRTFSKAYGLAGLRVGYAVAAPEIVALLQRGQQPFNVSEPALAAACAALEDDAHLARTVALNESGREWLVQRLLALGMEVYGGPTNFVLVDVREPAQRLHQRLAECGVLVRLMDAYGLKGCLRITIGLPEENQKVIAALTEAM
jgi:histidinol-phosphate aminotransferase